MQQSILADASVMVRESGRYAFEVRPPMLMWNLQDSRPILVTLRNRLDIQRGERVFVLVHQIMRGLTSVREASEDDIAGYDTLVVPVADLCSPASDARCYATPTALRNARYVPEGKICKAFIRDPVAPARFYECNVRKVRDSERVCFIEDPEYMSTEIVEMSLISGCYALYLRAPRSFSEIESAEYLWELVL